MQRVMIIINFPAWLSRGGNIQGVAYLQNQNYLVTESLNVYFKIKWMTIKISIYNNHSYHDTYDRDHAIDLA